MIHKSAGHLNPEIKTILNKKLDPQQVLELLKPEKIY